MRITFIKENRDAGTESISTCDTAAFITKIKSETKPGHVSALRTMLEYTSHGSGGTYGHIDKLPRICPAMEYGRSREGERRMKRYNGIERKSGNSSRMLIRVVLLFRHRA